MAGSLEKIKISSSVDLHRLEHFIEEILDYYNVPGEYFGNIMLAVSEAAIMGLKREGEVTIKIIKSRNGLNFLVTRKDAAIGDLDELDKAIERQAIARETFIIRSLADEAKLSHNGHTIELNFQVAGINLERALIRSEKVKGYFGRKEKVVGRNE
ncbi:MAG: hypothetical protein D4R67_04820 [Bacteroidetes bacterium]|nr:MAG: hypothetical protein D4R67_04820 [Bacteroidota bacterium]